MYKSSFIFFLGVLNFCFAQKNDFQNDTLKAVILNGSRIEILFKEDSRSIQIITAADIKKLGVTNLADALQVAAGIDVRRQGIAGMQADLYIRGGGFDQTLLLIDGFKVDDPQTGHHALNLALPIEVIKRIEILKGPAARIYGQNAFTGAVNIVTKDTQESNFTTKLQTGSYGQVLADATANLKLKTSKHLLHFSKNTAEGYRHNTDFNATNVLLKSVLNASKQPIEVLAAFSERKFGANGFYAIPTATEQYEATQASLIGLATTYQKNNFTWKPKLYWRRNEDEYLYIRSNPSAYRNLHITNKIALELNGSYSSYLGTSGFGVEFSNYFIDSNRLGSNKRQMISLFLEHRFQFFDQKLDITPGVVVSYFSDFQTQAFPGIDFGFQLSDIVKLYANFGKTYRVPTYTDLYYVGPQAVGNENLDPESAISEEIGVKITKNKWQFTTALFNRDATDLIDYVRLSAADAVFKPLNIQKVNTKGIETTFETSFLIANAPQRLQLNYTFIDDQVAPTTAAFSRYSMNSLKHQFTSTITQEWFKNWKNTVTFRYLERTSGYSYTLLDASVSYTITNLELSVYANNIFNTEYIETSLVPMPKGNMMFGLRYHFK